MSFADDLLLQAVALAGHDPGVPGQANLRRAVSAAYYAVFHKLVAEASERLSPAQPKGLSLRVARAFTHAEMRQVCKMIQSGGLSREIADLQPHGFSPELTSVASGFIELQIMRNSADYDLAVNFERNQTLDALDLAKLVFRAWSTVRATDEANVFLTALLLNSRWAK